MKRHGIKILGLSLLAVLGLMAISASAAQAEGHFLILETPGGSTKETGAAEGIAGAGTLLLASGLNIACTSASASAALQSKGMANVEVKFFGCSVEGNKFCKVYPTKADMTAKTNTGKLTATGLALARLHDKLHFLHVEGLGEAKAFSTVYTNTAAEGCTLPLENQVTGLELFVMPSALTHLKEQVIRAPTAGEFTLLAALGFKPKLMYGKEGATLHPAEITDAHMTGGDVDKEWGAL